MHWPLICWPSSNWDGVDVEECWEHVDTACGLCLIVTKGPEGLLFCQFESHAGMESNPSRNLWAAGVDLVVSLELLFMAWACINGAIEGRDGAIICIWCCWTSPATSRQWPSLLQPIAWWEDCIGGEAWSTRWWWLWVLWSGCGCPGGPWLTEFVISKPNHWLLPLGAANFGWGASRKGSSVTMEVPIGFCAHVS